MKRILCLMLLGIAGIILPEISKASICEPANTVVYLGNGVITSEDDAYDASIRISERLKATLSVYEYKLLQFDVSYNDTGGTFIDLLEASIQDLQTDHSRFWRILGGIEIMPDWFAGIMEELAVAKDAEALVTTDSLKDHLNDYKTKIAEGKKVLLVAHSQGNFFGNQAYGMLSNTERQSFGIVSVANPDSFVADDGPYTTLINDTFIWAITFVKAGLGLPSLPMTPYMVNNLSDINDITGHFFIDSYMVEGSNSDLKITGDMISVLDNLTKPNQLLEPGVITVTLIWEGATDIDLHVYEPNGYHVFWDAPHGYSGFLDRDDRSGYGPEHYTVETCDTLEKGTYRVALDYFEGDYPEVATVQVEAGLKVRVFRVAMPSEYYGSATYPVHLAYIRMQEAENGGYEFQID